MASLEPPLPAAVVGDLSSHGAGPASIDSHKGNSARWRRTLGLLLLALVVVFWTGSSFLASAILADHSFSNPFFVTYINTLFFILPLAPAVLHKAYRRPDEFHEWMNECRDAASKLSSRLGFRTGTHSHSRALDPTGGSTESLLRPARTPSQSPSIKRRHSESTHSANRLTLSETARLSLEFCLLWFGAGYILLACLQHTTVASSTILTSTASIFTLIFGAMIGVEKLTLRKSLSVILSLAGVALISSVDFSGKSSDDDHRGSFPEKTTGELAWGNTLALISAAIYALYITRLKKRVPDDSLVSMPVFFGLVGLFNAVMLFPFFFILHWTGVERFEFPPAGRVTWILLLNGAGSMISDVAWAYAVLLTSPVLVTVGLSMTIPLTLVGQMVLNEQTSTAVYWIGAMVVVSSFILVSHEENKEETVRQLEERDVER
ncbi:thiamine-repressible mitochondrial transport protein THI74 [Neohortaea acidophila]|uniref:Thiamine-repressible mitochondrial transport protein THI74 n=1 Tax=Neohortaea acidophila TaxID=245834 RepID=A0A6A6Q3S6_9PEZI|nr:thiamine-repressible mitochondrial transport protein THI74 [Neohortaea acidophila]KAF2486313.1 thiamine-repressible mitochondrial transport protein THI74 [Neohortaea acidophila]